LSATVQVHAWTTITTTMTTLATSRCFISPSSSLLISNSGSTLLPMMAFTTTSAGSTSSTVTSSSSSSSSALFFSDTNKDSANDSSNHMSTTTNNIFKGKNSDEFDGSDAANNVSSNSLTVTAATMEEEAMAIKEVFDIDQMGYNVMIRERTTRYQNGKINPQQLISAIKEDFMFGDEFTDYWNKNNDINNNTNDQNQNLIQIVEIGKYSEDFSSSTPLPKEYNLTIQEKGNYLLHISLTKELFTTLRVVVD